MTRRAVLAAALLCSGCTVVHQQAQPTTPSSRPAGDGGQLLYTVGRLTFEAPAGWAASGDARHVLLESGARDARIDAEVVTRGSGDKLYPDDATCLQAADAVLARGAAKYTAVRRHSTTFAGRKAVVQEADQGPWHGWAWAVCDRGEQYRIFFTGRSPLRDEALRAMRRLPASAALTAGPGA